MTRKRHHTPTIADILSRPAMNGGWDKLVQQQNEQLDELRAQSDQLRDLQAWRQVWDRRWIWFAGALGTVTVSVVGRLVWELLTKIQIVLH